jgi:ArsR family transcriptional regulator
MLRKNVGTVSQVLKSISHPLRLKILCLLQDRELSVGELHSELRTTTANISQHLALLRQQGIVKSRKDSNFIYNSITDQRVIKLIDTLQDLFC